MASNKTFLIVLAAVAMISAPAMAIEHLVGDDQGWKLNFDYKSWAESKEFHVGDKLIFKYKPEVHNVIRANQSAFQSCVPEGNVAPLTSGNDVITLVTPGKKWHFCGVKNHCEQGMKLAINVLSELGSPATSPFPSVNPGSSTALGIAPSSILFASMVSTLVIFLMIMA